MNPMRTATAFAGAALVAALAVPAMAQTPAPAAAPAAPAVAAAPLVPPTVMIVDMNRVLQESNAGRSIQKQLEDYSKALNVEVQKLEEELKGKDAELRRQRTILSAQAFEEQRQTVQRRAGEAQRTLQEKGQAIEKAQNEAVGVLLDSAREVISVLAGERKAQVVLSRQQILLLAEPNLEVTQTVLDRINARLPTVQVKVAAVAATASDAPAAAPAAAPAKPAAKK
jgi:Skp family chaperone for outer membrane proteins